MSKAVLVMDMPSSRVVDMYCPNNMTKEEFDEFLEETGYSKGE